MIDRPSLKALRVLLEVRRSGSYAVAAQRLGVTPSAVSHMIAALDAELGGTLFEDRRRARLSPRAERLVDSLEPAFQAIAHAVGQYRAQRASIRVSTLSSLAVLWLIPRLGRLRARLPNVDILVSTDLRPVDLNAEPFDCAIRWATSPPEAAGLVTLPLFREHLAVVASPRLLDGQKGASIAALPRLKARSRMDDWSLFLGDDDAGEPAAGITVFETRSQMLEAAVAGLGAAVIDLSLAEQSLAAGHLVDIGGRTVEQPVGYYFICRRAALDERPLRIFRDWLVEETASKSGEKGSAA
ncbi:LysR substrate-binding domain-containing protein [Pelagibius sp.]|uniref:LysR substrate-binding domain-containing protein n=1 Tax=Pelagibius sp. TaxID=1931238 RepID=UPI003B50769D